MKYKALLFCPDEKTARVVTQVLTDLEFRVEPCNEPFAAVKKLMAEHFDAIVVDCDSEQNAALLFKSAHNSGSNQSSLAVAVVEGQTGVAKAFRIGANLVLTKPINVEQSKGTLRVARGLLRKTEAGKPASGAASRGQSAEPVRPPSGSQMPAPFLPAQPAPSPIPAVNASIFDVEADPTPKPEPAEAALLESMPAPVPPSAPAKDYPWQPISKPAAEPMATALRRAAEVTGRSADAPAKNIAAAAVVPPVPFAPSFTTSMASGQGAATAPAKIAPKTYEKEDEPETTQLDAPAFASLGAEPKEKSSGGGNKTMMIAAAAVIAVATIGYIGWTKMQSGPTPGAQHATPPAHVAQAPVQPPVSEDVAQLASSAHGSASAEKSSQSATPQEVEQGPDVTLSTKAERASADRPSPYKKSNSTVAANAAPQTTPATKSAPIVVKNEASTPVPPSPFQTDSAQPPAAGSLTAASNTNDAAISGIMSTVAVSTPQQAPQKLKVSQGVSQGLLIKSVDPVYPALARQMRIQGAVELLASIGADGSITSVKLLSGDSILAQAAITAVKQWKYKPYYLGDQPVAIQTQITMKFKLP
jgi:TonB family protein